MDEFKDKEQNLINKIIPKIDEYFSKNKILEKTKLKEFIEFIQFPSISTEDNNTLSLFWKEISKNSNDKDITKELLIKNLVDYIHNNNEEILSLEPSSSNSISSFLERPVKLIEDIDGEDELIFELYLLLATVDLTEGQNLPLSLLENALNEYKFINLTKESIGEILEELLKEKSGAINRYDFLEMMEQMGKEYLYKLEAKAQEKLPFAEEDLATPELKSFIYLLSFLAVLSKISDSIVSCHQNSIKVIKEKDTLNEEYLSRNFFVLINNMKLYLFEIMKIYYQQKQKFEYFSINNNSRISILKQQKKELEEQLKEKDNDENDNDKILKTLYDELKTEKNKVDDLFKENQNLKKKNSNYENNIYDYDIKIQELNRTIKEKEEAINSLKNKNNSLLEQKNELFSKLNDLLLTKKEKKERFNESMKKLNLSNNLLNLITMQKADIIASYNEKEKNYNLLQKDNKSLKNKILELEKNAQMKEEELDEVKRKNFSLNEKNQALEKELETKNSNEEPDNSLKKSYVLGDFIEEEKVDKEDYDFLEQQLTQEKEKNQKMKKNINQLKEDLSKKEEDLIKNENAINSQENQIKNLNEQINKNKDIYNELLNKYQEIKTKIEEDQIKFNKAIELLNLSEKYKRLINTEKSDLIKIILDKDNHITKLEEENASNKQEIKDLNNIKQELSEEKSKNDSKILYLNKAITNLNKEIKTSNESITLLQKNLREKEYELNKEKENKEKSENDLTNEKKKNELLTIDNKKMSNEIITQKELISKSNNEISLLQNKNKEKEEQILSLSKEKEMLNTNYKELLDKYNEQLSNTKQKEQSANIAIKNLNLSEEYSKLGNMTQVQLILLIIEKDKYLKMTEDSNKDLKEKLDKILKEKNILEEESNKLKLNIVDLDNKNNLLIQEKDNINKNIDDLKLEKDNSLSDLHKEKTEKENLIKEIDSLKEEIKDLNQKINTLKTDIDKLTQENKSKEENLLKLENDLKSKKSLIIKIEIQKTELSQKHKELTEKYNNQLQTINDYTLKEKAELDSIKKLNLSSNYQLLTSKTKSDLISLVIEKDNINEKIETEKTELNNGINDLKKNLSEFEANNNILNNKIKNLENEIITMKNEIDNLIKEKEQLNNLLKKEKKSGEKMKTAHDLLNQENKKIESLTKENKKLTEEITNLNDIITKTKNELQLNKQQLEENESKNAETIKELVSLKSQYLDLLNKYKSQNTLLLNQEKAKEAALKDLEEKYKFIKDLSIEALIKLIIEKDKLYITAFEEINKLKKENSDMSKRIIQLGEYNQKYFSLKEKYDEAEKDNQLLIKERDEYKNKLDDIIKKKINKEKEYKFKSNLLALINTSQIHIKKKIAKKETKRFNMNNYLEEKTYDFLCLRYEKTIIDSLKDSHYDTFTVFSESINYVLDQNKKVIQECILFITMEYFYLYNTNYKCCFACPLIDLVFVSFSNNNNYLSFIFQRSENVIFETFRILELVNFMRLLKAKRKTLNFAIESESYVFNEQKGNKKNYIENLYFGKGSFSGSFKKEVTSMKGLYNHYEDRFGVLCDVGLIIFESPNGKPKEIINLLFADVGFIIGEKTKLDIKVREKIHRFWFKTEWIRNEWKKKIDFWKKSNSNLTKFN